VVRHFALNLVRQVADKRSIKRRRKRAAWDPQYLLEGAIQSDAAYAVDWRIEGGLAYGGGETERRGVFGNS
jgi:hypothetical protein